MQARGLAIATTVAILLSSCAGPTDAPTPEAPDPKRNAMRFERIAKIDEQSCMCRMAGRDTTKIDRELEQLTASLKEEGSDSASVPLQGQSTCYPELGERACIGRIVITGSSSESDFVCSEEQANELQTVWDAAGEDGMTLPKRDRALRKRLKAMQAEAAAVIPQSACN